MRALVASDLQPELQVREVPDVSPGPGQVSIRVEVAGINFADVLSLRGEHGYSSAGPRILGLEVVGKVEALGSGVNEFHPGQRVAAYTGGGGFAELALANVSLVVSVPDEILSTAAVAVPVTLSTAYLLLEDVARVRIGDRLLVHSAAGGIGLSLAALARSYAPDVLVGTVSSEDKVKHALDGGYDHVFVRGGDLVSQVEVATAGLRATVVFGALGTDGLADDLRMTAPTGRIVRYGNAPGSPLAALPSLADLNAANLSIAGFSRRALARQDPSRVAASFAATMAVLAAGKVNLPTTEIGGLSALPDFLGSMANGRTFGKSVVRVAD